MEGKGLVAYGSKYGATAEIAERIARVLERAGLEVDVLPADRAGDLGPYGAVVVGSAVYAGRWRSEAAAFMEAHEAELAERPVWLFSSGPTGEGDPVTLEGWRLPANQMLIATRIEARDIALFHGKLDKGKLNLIE